MKELLMRSGCKVPFPERLFECYAFGDNRIMANVGADKLPAMMTHFISMHDEPLFFILELPTNKNDEPDIENSVHTDVYYIDGLNKAQASEILKRVGDILYSDGIAAFGFGCHNSGDEFFSIEYNSVVLFSKNPEKYELFFTEHDIPKTDNYVSAWDIVTDENPAESFAVTVGKKTIYDIPEMLKDMGIYLAERRERYERDKENIMSEKIPERAEIPEKSRWSIEDIYANDELWEEDYKKAKEYADKTLGFKGKLCSSAEKMLEYCRMDDELTVLLDKLMNYAQRKSDEDTRISKYQDMSNRLGMLFVALSDASSFAAPEIISISDETLKKFFEEMPELKLYKRALERIRIRREHILSENEERIIALAGEMAEAPDTVFSMFNDADLVFPDAVDSSGNLHQVTHESYGAYRRSPDRTLRKTSFESIHKTYAGFKNTCAAMLSSQVKSLVFNAKARRYSSTLEAALSANEVDTAVYRQLIKSVRDNLEPLHRYVKLCKKALGTEDFHAYDFSAPCVEGVEMKIPFEQAVEEVYEALEPMGEEYRAIFRKGIDERWVDIYENVGKRSGAYSAGARVHPFVLLNHKDTLNCEFTLAHEMGHAIHSYLSNKNQPVVYSDYVIFVAEVASTCNESLLIRHLLKKCTDKKLRVYLVNYFLEQFRTTFYRQAMFAEFELSINEIVENGGSLTSDKLNELYHKLNVDYYGEGLTVDEELDVEWARIPHFYYNYYVYQYATGYLAAIALSERILTEGESAVKDYIGFLSGGSSKDPISLLRDAGVDMTSEKPAENAMILFNRLIDEMEALIG